MPVAASSAGPTGGRLGCSAWRGTRQSCATARDTVARALENMADAFVSVDSGWRVTYVNRPAAELMHVDRLTAPGQLLWDLWPAMVNSGTTGRSTLAIETGEPATFPLYDVEGDRWHQLRVVPASDAISLFATDITEVRAAELERARDLTRQEQARRVLAYSQALAEADSVSDVTEVVATMVLPAFDATGCSCPSPTPASCGWPGTPATGRRPWKHWTGCRSTPTRRSPR